METPVSQWVHQTFSKISRFPWSGTRAQSLTAGSSAKFGIESVVIQLKPLPYARSLPKSGHRSDNLRRHWLLFVVMAGVGSMNMGFIAGDVPLGFRK
jgi:hypothetical protein